MKLYHYSTGPFELDPKFDYSIKHVGPGKPYGFWLSDESREQGWLGWCQENEFHPERLRYKTEFEIVNTSKLCILSSKDDVETFSKKWGNYDKTPFLLYIQLCFELNWELVQSTYSGILISPYYFSEWRHEHLWYYGWDCASACIWDLSILKQGEQVEL